MARSPEPVPAGPADRVETVPQPEVHALWDASWRRDLAGIPRLDATVAQLVARERLNDRVVAVTDLVVREEGRVGSVGVSNFTEPMLTRLIDETGVVPAVNQVELHPYFPQAALRAFHAEHGIRTESWSPLARRSELLREPVIVELAERHGVTPTQVVLRWHTLLGSTPIPKSADPARQIENADVFGIGLSLDEIAAVTGLQRGRLWDGDPDTHEEM